MKFILALTVFAGLFLLCGIGLAHVAAILGVIGLLAFFNWTDKNA